MDAVAAFPWSEVGRRETPASVRDLWRHADLTPSATGFSARVPSHGVILLAVR
jgi:alpha-galactosidase